MAVKADLYSVGEGRDSSAGTSPRKGGHDGGKFARQKGNLGTIEEGPQADLVVTMAEKKKLQGLKKKT